MRIGKLWYWGGESFPEKSCKWKHFVKLGLVPLNCRRLSVVIYSILLIERVSIDIQCPSEPHCGWSSETTHIEKMGYCPKWSFHSNSPLPWHLWLQEEGWWLAGTLQFSGSAQHLCRRVAYLDSVVASWESHFDLLSWFWDFTFCSLLQPKIATEVYEQNSTRKPNGSKVLVENWSGTFARVSLEIDKNGNEVRLVRRGGGRLKWTERADLRWQGESLIIQASKVEIIHGLQNDW